MSDAVNDFTRYLPAELQSVNWGWRVVDAGRQVVPPNTAYPVGKHPNAYFFDADGFRVLDEYQIVFIVEGSGVFESDSIAQTAVTAGDALLIFPRERHAYRPLKETGWTECWVGFQGREATRLIAEFFSPSEPVIHLSQSDAMLRHFDQLLDWLKKPVAGREQILSGHLPLMLAFLYSGKLAEEETSHPDESFMIQAKAELLSNLSEPKDLQELAKKLGVSYSRFRFAFKRHTGYSPRDYENLIKLNRARDMLLHEGMSVSATANALGYTSIQYFSRAFKKRFGKSPREWALVSSD